MSDPEQFSAPGQTDIPITKRLLTFEEQAFATDWVNAKSQLENDACLVCGSPKSVVQPAIVQMPGGLNPYDGQPNWTHPSIVVVCHNCGFTRYFNAVVMGMVAGFSPDSEEVSNA